MKNFYQICTVENIEELQEQFEYVEFPCTVLVGYDNKETRDEGLEIVFGKKVDADI